MPMGKGYRKEDYDNIGGHGPIDGIRGMVLKGLMQQMDNRMGSSRMSGMGGGMGAGPFGGEGMDLELDSMGDDPRMKRKSRGGMVPGDPRGY